MPGSIVKAGNLDDTTLCMGRIVYSAFRRRIVTELPGKAY
jgi:hypothetical protein